MCQNTGLQPGVHEREPLKIKQRKEMRSRFFVHTTAETAALGVVHGPPEAGRGILGVEIEALGVRHGKLDPENPRLDPENLPPGVEHGGPEVENPAHGVENGKLEVEHEPLELGNQRLEVEKKRVDSVRRPRRVGGNALDRGDGAGLGQDSGPGRAGRRAQARWAMAH